MLNLIAGEFAKLKRKKIVPFIILLSLLFPLIVVYTSKMGMGNDTSLEFLKGRFDLSYTMMLGYGVSLRIYELFLLDGQYLCRLGF